MTTKPSITELSSISTSLDDLTTRVGNLADELSRSGQDGLASDLFEVERSLKAGARRLNRIVND